VRGFAPSCSRVASAPIAAPVPPTTAPEAPPGQGRIQKAIELTPTGGAPGYQQQGPGLRFSDGSFATADVVCYAGGPVMAEYAYPFNFSLAWTFGTPVPSVFFIRLHTWSFAAQQWFDDPWQQVSDTSQNASGIGQPPRQYRNLPYRGWFFVRLEMWRDMGNGTSESGVLDLSVSQGGTVGSQQNTGYCAL
jgi:hypothetical protein